jgi:hypothetical protein
MPTSVSVLTSLYAPKDCLPSAFSPSTCLQLHLIVRRVFLLLLLFQNPPPCVRVQGARLHFCCSCSCSAVAVALRSLASAVACTSSKGTGIEGGGVGVVYIIAARERRVSSVNVLRRFVRLHIKIQMCVHLYEDQSVCVCERERERERDTQTER